MKQDGEGKEDAVEMYSMVQEKKPQSKKNPRTTDASV